MRQQQELIGVGVLAIVHLFLSVLVGGFSYSKDLKKYITPSNIGIFSAVSFVVNVIIIWLVYFILYKKH